MFEFPPLEGPYAVGTTTRHLVDINRVEPHDPQYSRELMVHLWYPIDPQHKKEIAPYNKEAREIMQRLNSLMNIPEDQTNESYNSVYTHSLPDLQPAPRSAPYPVILFSHGYKSSLVELYDAFCQNLASNGFIVAGINHSYWSSTITLPTGRVIETNEPKLAMQFDRMLLDQEVWLADAQFVLDSLQKINNNKNEPLYSLCNTQNAGMFGHSFGGTTAFLMAMKDDRIKAGAGLDSPLLCHYKATDLTKPFLFFWAEQSLKDYNLTDGQLIAKYSKFEPQELRKFRNAYKNTYQESKDHITIKDIAHGGFSDLLILKDLPCYKSTTQKGEPNVMTGIVGACNGQETMALINKNLADFFKVHLLSTSV